MREDFLAGELDGLTDRYERAAEELGKSQDTLRLFIGKCRHLLSDRAITQHEGELGRALDRAAQVMQDAKERLEQKPATTGGDDDG